MTMVSRPVIVVCFTIVVGMVAAACGDDPPELPPPASPQPSASAAASPSSSLSPEDAEAAEEILEAFDAYMQALIELSNEGVPGGTEETLARLEEVPVTGEAETALRFDLLTDNFLAGRRTSGSPVWAADVIEIDWEFSYQHNPDVVFPLATLRVCFDESNWTTVDASTGEVVEGPGSRYLSTVTAEWAESFNEVPIEPGWYINSREDGSEPC